LANISSLIVAAIFNSTKQCNWNRVLGRTWQSLAKTVTHEWLQISIYTE